jgi:hypothetical protein
MIDDKIAGLSPEQQEGIASRADELIREQRDGGQAE